MKLPNNVIKRINFSMRHMMLSQCNLAVDFIEENTSNSLDNVTKFTETNMNFIENNLELFNSLLKDLEILANENIV
jgi:hypothetical protein